MIDKITVDLVPKALGTNILVLSMLLSANRPIEIQSSARGAEEFVNLKKWFDISDERLLISTKENINDISGSISDSCKLFSPFLPVEHLCLFDRLYPVTARRKPCIGLSWFAGQNCYNDAESPLPNNRFPYNRHHSMEQYQQLFRLLKRSGYDVITFDNTHTTVEQKLFMLNEFCDCVITYEGGLAMMAHVLKIPTIVLPWHHSADGTVVIGRGSWCDLYCQSLHLSRNTWFPESINELFSWNAEQLKEIIDLCHKDRGNNLFFSADQITIFENLSECRLHFPGKMLKFKTTLTDWEKNFIKTHIPKHTIA